MFSEAGKPLRGSYCSDLAEKKRMLVGVRASCCLSSTVSSRSEKGIESWSAFFQRASSSLTSSLRISSTDDGPLPETHKVPVKNHWNRPYFWAYLLKQHGHVRIQTRRIFGNITESSIRCYEINLYGISVETMEETRRSVGSRDRL